MGIFDALNTSVGGLQAQSFALQNISGNIANASTTGYKGIGTTFEDLDPGRHDAQASRSPAASTAFAQATITTQGTVSTSTVGTNMAINGDGFFSVQKPTSVTDNVPVFSGVTDYTRRGDFQVNANGNLVNGAGYYLMGVDGRPEDRQPDRQRAAGAAIPEQLHPGAGDQRHHICRQPADPAEDAGEHDGGRRHPHRGRRPQPVRLRLQPVAGRHAGAALYRRHHHRHRSSTTATRRQRRSRRHRPLSGTAADANSLRHELRCRSTPSRSTARRSPSSTRSTASTGAPASTSPTPSARCSTRLTVITGVAATDQRHRAGAITLHTGTAQDLDDQSASAGTARPRSPRSASSPARRLRGGGGTAGTGVVIGNDLQTFTNEFDQRRRGDGLQRGGHAGEPAIALGQDRQRLARRRAPGHLEPVLSDQHHRDRRAGRPGSTSARTSPSVPTARCPRRPARPSPFPA